MGKWVFLLKDKSLDSNRLSLCVPCVLCGKVLLKGIRAFSTLCEESRTRSLV